MQGYILSVLAACCVALAVAPCVARLAALYEGPDPLGLLEHGGERALRALLPAADQDSRLAWVLSEAELDLEARLLHWAAAPRVAARVSVAAGFLFAALSFRTILDAEAPVDADGGALLAGVCYAAAPMLWGMAGLATALAADHHARVRAKELRRASALLAGLMCVPGAPLVRHELAENRGDRVA
jgi:hypothetical protein